jgi:hypothetical protein
MINSFGNNKRLLKGFLTGDKDYMEISAFLEYIKSSEIETIEDKVSIYNFALIGFLNKLSTKDKFDNFYYLLDKMGKNLLTEIGNDNYGKIVICFLMNCIYKNSNALLF